MIIRWLRPLAIPLLVFSCALGLRLWHVISSYDLFIDEVTYGDLARSAAHGHGVVLYGRPFLLHPPLSFLAMGGVLHVLRPEAPLIDAIWLLRSYIAVWGAVCVLLTFSVVRRVCGQSLALVAAGLLAIEPFAIRFDSRVLMEAEAQALVLSSVAAVLLSCWARTPRGCALASAAAGLLAGLAMCTKETFGMVAFALLALLWVTGWALERREAVRALVVGVCVYAVSSGSLVLAFGFDQWWAARSHGLSRLIGTNQITGFNAPNTQVSLGSRVIANLDQFAATYAIMVMGGVAAGLLVLCAWSRQRRSGVAAVSCEEKGRVVLGIWGVAACGYLVYATLIGSIEEQMYYILLAPCTIAATIVGHDLAIRDRKWVREAVVVTLAVMLAFNGQVWYRTHTTVDNTYERFLSWSPRGLPQGSVISVTDVAAQFLIQGAKIGIWTSPEALKQHGVDYVLIVTELVKQGYSDANPEFVTYLDKHARLVFDVHGRSAGALRIYDVRAITGGSG